jgi:hypothetical protein
MNESHTCARRAEHWLAAGEKNSDTWRQVGNDHCCSYCGSMHPDEFAAFLKSVVSDPDPNVKVIDTDKQYKYYVRRPHISNAMQGAIKFYMQHAPIDPDHQDRYQREFVDLLRAALIASAGK